MDDDIEKMLSEEDGSDNNSREENNGSENVENSPSYEEIASEKLRLEQEVEKQRQYIEKNRRDRDREVAAANFKKKRGEEDGDEDIDLSRDEEVVFKKLQAAKRSDLEDLESRILTQVKAERLGATLENQVKDYAKKYPFVKEGDIQEYMKRNPLSTVDEAINAKYGRKIAEFEYESNQDFPFADHSDNEMTFPKSTEEVPLNDRRAFTNAIKKALIRE